MNKVTQSDWWARNNLDYRDGRLFLGEQDLSRLARAAGTPCFAYHAPRVIEKLDGLHNALDKHGVRHSIYYALKANRYQPLLTYLRLKGNCGIDACSPRELLLARQVGFQEPEITYTGTSVSNRDLDVVAAHPEVQFNCDAISTIHRLGERCPGRRIGLRVNPEASASYLEHISYAGEKATKFGIYADRFEEALSVAESYDLHVTTLHFHSALGYLNPQLDGFRTILDHVAGMLEKAPQVKCVDIGGGLGTPLRAEDAPLDLEAWAGLLAEFANPRQLEIQIEPGDYLVKDAGALLVEVNSVEEKGGTCFVGVNAGFNLTNLHAFYRFPLVVTPLCLEPGAETRKVTIAGNINEGVDTLAEDIEMPVVKEGDLMALLNIGGYSVSCGSDHCMRGDFSEYLILD